MRGLMGSKLFVVPMLGLALTATGCSSKGTSSYPTSKNTSTSSSGVTTLKPYRELTLDNGLNVLFLPDQSLPSLTLSLLVKSGATTDPQGMSGLSNLVSELLDQGTKKRDASTIADDLALIGANFDASVSYDYSSVVLSGLSFSSDKILANFAEITMEPSFPDAEITRMKKQIMARIERGLDNPRGVADMAAESLLYGTHPYGRSVVGRYHQVEALTKKAVIQHYLRYYRPNNSILAVIGKFDADFEKQVEKTFGAWAKRDMPKPVNEAPQEYPGKGGPRIRLVEKAGLTQAQIRFVGLGIRREDPDFLALRLANTAFGGAFASRLNERIRKNLGLTYSINSSFDSRLMRGPFEIETFTKVESIEKVVTETMALYRELIANGITREELDRSRGYLRGIFPQAIETSEKLAFNLMLLRRYGISDRYLTHYVSDLDDLSVSEVNSAIRRALKPEGLSIVIHAPKGSADALQAKASAFESVPVESLK